jgi:hypothetical protein
VDGWLPAVGGAILCRAIRNSVSSVFSFQSAITKRLAHPKAVAWFTVGAAKVLADRSSRPRDALDDAPPILNARHVVAINAEARTRHVPCERVAREVDNAPRLRLRMFGDKLTAKNPLHHERAEKNRSLCDFAFHELSYANARVLGMGPEGLLLGRETVQEKQKRLTMSGAS